MRINKKISMCLTVAAIFLGSAYEGECLKSGRFVNGREDIIIVISEGEVRGTYSKAENDWPWMANRLEDGSYRYEHECKNTGTCPAEIHPTGSLTLVENIGAVDGIIVDILSDDNRYSKRDVFTKKEEK